MERKKEFKKLILLAVKFFSVLFVTYLCYELLFWFLWESKAGPNAYDESYQRALLRQYNALADENRDNEIIVFGSSYVPFGIDPDTVKEITGSDCQILGIEAGIGIPILVDILYETVKPGDTVVYMLGKSNWYNEDFMTLSAAFEADKEVLDWYWNSRNSNIKPYKNMLIWRKMYALLWSKPIEYVRYNITHKEQVYALSSFDEKGNMTAPREGTQISMDVSPTDHLTFEDMEIETLDMLNEFAKWCNYNDVTFVIAYGMNIEGSMATSDEELLEYHKQMCDYMKADILLTPQDYFLPVDDFFNHEAHLNTKGAKEYSAIMANALAEYLKSKE